MRFNKLFPTFETFQKVLLSFDVPSANIVEVDYNFVKALIANNSLFTDELNQLYANLALQWNEQYNIYQQQLPFYTKKLEDLNEQINTAIQGLYDLASNENNTFQFDIKNFTKADMNKYLSGFTADTRDQAKAYIDNFQNFNNYFQTLRANNPRINFYKNVITEITLPLNTKNADIYADFWKIEKSSLKNNTKLPLDNDMQVIKNIAAALNDNEVPNLAQVKALIPKSTSLWIENSGQIQPKKAWLVSMLDQRIASVANPLNSQDATNKKYVDNLTTTNKNNIEINTKVGVINTSNIAKLLPLQSAFRTKVENSQVEQIANIKSNSKLCDFIVSGSELILRDVPKPKQGIDLTSNNTGLYNAELNNKLQLTDTSYKFIWNLEIHNQNKEDFIHVWPNTTIQQYHANGVPIDQKGGSFIILPVNGDFRIKAESASNPTKRVIQAHFWYYQNYQIMLVFSDGSVEYIPNLLKQKQIIIKQNNLIYEVQ